MEASVLLLVIRAGGCLRDFQVLNFQVLGHLFSPLAPGGSVLKLFEVIIVRKQCPCICPGLLKNTPPSIPSSYPPSSFREQAGQVKPYEIASIQLFLFFTYKTSNFT